MGGFVRWIQKAMMSKQARCPEEEHCLELVRLMLDDQATPEDSEYVTKHIDGCYRCYDNYDLENAIREAVRNKTNKEKVPDELVAEINEKIRL
jgi:anti-sigma factor (TIGR02949 family)